MTGFGRDSDNERFHRPQALAIKRAVPGFAIVLAAAVAVAFALLFSIAVTRGVDWPVI